MHYIIFPFIFDRTSGSPPIYKSSSSNNYSEKWNTGVIFFCDAFQFLFMESPESQQPFGNLNKADIDGISARRRIETSRTVTPGGTLVTTTTTTTERPRDAGEPSYNGVYSQMFTKTGPKFDRFIYFYCVKSKGLSLMVEPEMMKFKNVYLRQGNNRLSSCCFASSLKIYHMQK